jgi:hypothetical protein
MYSNNYFWRTYDQQEIDMIEERDGKLWAYEFKWNPKKTPSAPKVFTETYKNASYKCITPDNFIDFLE